MHEISLVRQILSTLEQTLPQDELTRLSGIKLRVGVLSNVQPILMQNAFEAVTATDAPQYRRVTLSLEVLPVLVDCKLCGHKSQIDNYVFKCSQCGVPCNNIVQGEELMIAGVEFEKE